jgi:DNA gyrase/topoisomerase IV subunit A
MIAPEYINFEGLNAHMSGVGELYYAKGGTNSLDLGVSSVTKTNYASSSEKVTYKFENLDDAQATDIATVGENDDIMIITEDGTIIRTPVNGIPVYEGNNTTGVIIMRLSENNRIISFAATKSDEEEAAEIEASIEKNEAMEATEISFPIADEDEI